MITNACKVCNILFVFIILCVSYGIGNLLKAIVEEIFFTFKFNIKMSINIHDIFSELKPFLLKWRNFE